MKENTNNKPLDELEIYDLLIKARESVKEKNELYELYKKHKGEKGSPCFDYIKKRIEKCYYGQELDNDPSYLRSKEECEKIKGLSTMFKDEHVSFVVPPSPLVNFESNKRQTFTLTFTEEPLNEIPSRAVRSVSLPALTHKGYSYIVVYDVLSEPSVLEILKKAIKNGSCFSYKFDFHNTKGDTINTLFVQDVSDENARVRIEFKDESNCLSASPMTYSTEPMIYTISFLSRIIE